MNDDDLEIVHIKHVHAPFYLTVETLSSYPDVRIISRDRIEFSINRTVLASFSSVFRTIVLNQNPFRDEEIVVLITDIPSHHLSEIIRFCITGKYVIVFQNPSETRILRRSFESLGIDVPQLSNPKSDFRKSKENKTEESSVYPEREKENLRGLNRKDFRKRDDRKDHWSNSFESEGIDSNNNNNNKSRKRKKERKNLVSPDVKSVKPICVICRREFTKWTELQSHKKENHGNDLVCPICGKLFPGYFLSKYNDHVRNHSSSSLSDQCVNCGNVIKKSRTRSYSIEKHYQVYPYHTSGCNYSDCDATFDRFEDRVNHVNAQHDGIMRHCCGICPQQFHGEPQVRVHRRREHYRCKSRSEKEICPECGNSYTQSHFKMHMQDSHGREPSACDKCGRIFKHPESLKRHLNVTHLQFRCEHCGKVFDSRSSYKRHLGKHLPNHMKPHICRICHKGFDQKIYYDDHMNVHSGQKPHRCGYCDLGFANKANMKAHEKSIHKGIKRNLTKVTQKKGIEGIISSSD